MSEETSKAAQSARAEMRRLWKIDEDPRPGPKAAHTARDVARAGIAIADKEGLAALSMRRVGAMLSVSAMSLYNQVPGKAELLEVMVDEVAGELTETTSGAWQERVRAIAQANWDSLMRHPWLVGLDSYRPVLGPNVLLKYDVELAAFEGLGLTDLEMDFALNSLLGLIRGCAATAIDANGSLKDGSATDAEWWEARAPLLEKLAITDRFPIASRVGSAVGEHSGGPQAPTDAFRFGLDLWIAGLDARVGGHQSLKG